MKIRLRIALLVLSAVAVSLPIGAFAARANAIEIGYFDANGEMNGSITYFCDNGKFIEGQLIGTPRVIWSMSCNP